jgi:lipopolysaccharide export system permease protein
VRRRESLGAPRGAVAPGGPAAPPFSTMDRYLAATYGRAAVATLLAVVSVVVVIDFADRAHSFEGPGWIANVLRLYANLSLDLAYQVAPSALLLAAGVAVSGLRRGGELTALMALGVNPRRVLTTMALSCAVACGLVALANEWVVVDAARRAEEIKSAAFGHRADLRPYFSEQRWFRGDNRIYNIRGVSGSHFLDVSIYEMGPGFRLSRRIDAARMSPAPGGWRFENAEISTFREGQRLTESHVDDLVLPLPESAEDFRLRVGRPRQFTFAELVEQIAVRERVGLETAEYRLELQGRVAYPFTAVPGALLAILLAMRRDRKGHLTTALAEGIGISIVMWSMLIVFRALGTSGKLPPAAAAWMPFAVLAAAVVGYLLLEARRSARPRLAGLVPA